jgi:hypothetical protein
VRARGPRARGGLGLAVAEGDQRPQAEDRARIGIDGRGGGHRRLEGDPRRRRIAPFREDLVEMGLGQQDLRPQEAGIARDGLLEERAGAADARRVHARIGLLGAYEQLERSQIVGPLALGPGQPVPPDHAAALRQGGNDPGDERVAQGGPIACGPFEPVGPDEGAARRVDERGRHPDGCGLEIDASVHQVIGVEPVAERPVVDRRTG